jgi:hypothetical protein
MAVSVHRVTIAGKPSIKTLWLGSRGPRRSPKSLPKIRSRPLRVRESSDKSSMLGDWAAPSPPRKAKSDTLAIQKGSGFMPPFLSPKPGRMDGTIFSPRCELD